MKEQLLSKTEIENKLKDLEKKILKQTLTKLEVAKKLKEIKEVKKRLTNQVLTKYQIEEKLKESERKLSSQITRKVNLTFNEVKKEESILEKKRIEKQEKKEDQEWSIVKNKEERILALEQKISSFVEFSEKVIKQSNDFMEAFNKHVDKNNDDFETISKALRGEKGE